MKYKTKIEYLNRQEAMDLLKEFLKSDKNILKKIHDRYSVDFTDPDLKIKVLSGGFNKETADQELKGFYFCEIPAEAKKDIKRWNPESKDQFYCDLYGIKCELLRCFNSYYNIDRLRKNQNIRWYIIEAENKKNKNITDVDLLYNRINIIYNFGSGIDYNFINLDNKNKRYFSFTSLFYNTRYRNDEIIDRSGYIKLFKIEALKNKVKKIKAEKAEKKALQDRSDFEKLEKKSILKDLNNTFIYNMELIKNNINIYDFKFTRSIFDDSYFIKNAFYYSKLYNKIIQLNYNSIDEFKKDVEKFYSITAETILEEVKKDRFYWIVWREKKYDLDRDEFKNNLIIKNDVYIYKDFIFNKNDLTVKTGGSDLCI